MPKKGGAPQETKEELERKALVKAAQLKELRQKEERLGKINKHKIETEWRTKLREEKSKQLLNQSELLKQSLDRRTDHQNSLLSAVEQEIEDSETQLQFALRGHLINQDDLLQLQSQRLDKAYERFNSELADIENEFSTERERIVNQHNKDKEELVAIFQRMQFEFHESEANANNEHQSQREDFHTRHSEEKEALRIQLKSIKDDLWRQFQKALDDYNQVTAERKNQFDLLKNKDIESSKIIDVQTKKLIKIQDTISSLKDKLASNNRDYEDKVKIMRQQKDALQTQFQEMKRKMALFRGEERKKLTNLTIISATVLQVLKDKIEQAERILKLIEFCAPLETEDDHNWSQFEVELDENALAMLQKEDDNIKRLLEGSPFTSQERLALIMFYKRYNKVFLDKFMLERRQQKLLKEQLALKSQLKCYFDGMAVSEKILAEENTLFIVNGRTNAIENTDKRALIPHVDGPQLLKTQQLQLEL